MELRFSKRLLASLLCIGLMTLALLPLQSAWGEFKLSREALKAIEERGLNPDNVEAAVKTYTPTGKYDDYIMFASGGHSGQMLVIGLPSMRLLKLIAVFTPEPWQGYGYGSEESKKLLAEGNMNGTLSWGDTHHPALSETNGEYDGQFVFINDKANARIAVIDLRDFETKQIIKTPNILSDHGSTMVTPNTEYIIQGTQYATPIGIGEYAPIEDYKEKYRGMLTLFPFDREKGRVDMDGAFQIELPPYFQDLCDAGRGPSEGWIVCNSFNSEMSVGGMLEGKPPIEVGASMKDMDYLHVINWRKAVEVAKSGKTETISGMKVISLDTAVKEGILYFVGEPKSPHGADISPGGEYVVVAGKLDPHVTIYKFQKIFDAIKNKDFEGEDPYGVPILNFDSAVEAQVMLGLGPLHTQFDDKGYAYTSLFIESALAKWSLGEPYHSGGDAWQLVDKIPVNYNVGHLACAEGDTASPDGKYCVSLNKWSIDRFNVVGPLHPQNFQLIDVAGKKMKLLYDMPIGIGEPHYAQIIKADKLKPWIVYPEVGFNPLTMSKDPNAITAGKEKITRNGNVVEVWMTAIRSHFNPDLIRVKEGDMVKLHLSSIERARDATHGLAIDGYNINLSVEPGESITTEFVADKAGVFPFYCTEFCSALHLEMAGYLLVEPK